MNTMARSRLGTHRLVAWPALAAGLLLACLALAGCRREAVAPVRFWAMGREAEVVAELVAEFERRNWALPNRIDRVYDSRLAQRELGWRALYGFDAVLAEVDAAEPASPQRGPLADLAPPGPQQAMPAA